MMKCIKVRFAPSPTGYLHIGGLRTALYNYLFAKQNNGEIILRIEDTDTNRIVEGAAKKLINIFQKFNIAFDEGPDKCDSTDLYFQSNRINIYSNYAANLLDSGYAYKSHLTQDNLNKIRRETEQLKESAYYFRNRVRECSNKEHNNDGNYVIRLKVPDNETIEFFDQIRGKVKFNTNELDDQVLIKGDGFPTYHLANVVDDYEMGISHVIRGEEWLSSTPKHIILYNALGLRLPKFTHLPLLLNPDKTKLSKRQGDVSVEDFLDKGYLPDAIINFVALLGWHPEDNDEILSIDKLIDTFTLDRVQKGGAVFEIDKLNWINSQYIKKLSTNNFIKQSYKYLPNSMKELKDKDKFRKIIEVVKCRIKKLNELEDEVGMFYNALKYDDESTNLLMNKKNVSIFTYWLDCLSNIKVISNDKIFDLLKKTEKKFNVKGKELFFPIRLALYGNIKGPGIAEICDILQKDEIVNRLNNVLEKQ